MYWFVQHTNVMSCYGSDQADLTEAAVGEWIA